MSVTKYFWIVALVVASASCSKAPEPFDSWDNPEFYAKGSIDGKEIDIVAGDDDYYMFTGTALDEMDINSIYGELRSSKCSNCKPALRFSFRQKDSTGVIDPNDLLRLGKVNFWSTAYWEANFTTEIFGGNEQTSYNWDFGNGITSTAKNPRQRFLIENGVDSLKVCLQVNNSKHICNNIYFPNCAFNASFTTNRYTSQYCKAMIECRANSVEGENITYTWKSFLGEITTEQRNITMIYHYSYPVPIDIVRLSITDAWGNIANTSKYVVIDPLNASLTPNFDYHVVRVGTPDIQGLGTFELNYSDEKGILYSSKNTPFSNHVNSFKITNVEDYTENEKGQLTKKVSFEYSGMLYSAYGVDSLEVNNLTGAISVAY